MLAYFEWWDCPRSGIALLDGEPRYFAGDFPDVLDEYESEFRLWPAAPEARQRENEWQARWVEWRSAHDREGHPSSILHDAAFAELTRCLKESRTPPAATVRSCPVVWCK